MKVFRIIVAAAAFAAFAILAHTQTRPATAPVQANVAVIDSSDFSNEKTGIARVMAAMQQIEVKFGPIDTELRGMRQRLDTMRADIQKKRPVQDPKLTAQQTEEADRLEVQIKRKSEDAQSSYRKESLAILEPLQKDIGTALVAYAQSRGITLLVDVNRTPVVYAAASLNITSEFIADYNRTHPAGTAPAAAPATRPAATPATRPTRP